MQVSYDSTIALLGICPRKMKTYVHAKNLYMNVHSCFIHNNPKQETTQMSYHRWIVTQVIVPAIKRNKLLRHKTTLDESTGNYAEWGEKPIQKD